MLNHIVMQVGMEDTQRGYLEPVKGYIVSRVYHLLALVDQPYNSDITNIIWNKVGKRFFFCVTSSSKSGFYQR